MGKEVKNVIVIKNMYNEMFEEVIFVLKKGMPDYILKDKNMVLEARKIVEDYINRTSKTVSDTRQKDKTSYELHGYERGSKINIILNACLFIAIVLFAVIMGSMF